MKLQVRQGGAGVPARSAVATLFALWIPHFAVLHNTYVQHLHFTSSGRALHPAVSAQDSAPVPQGLAPRLWQAGCSGAARTCSPCRGHPKALWVALPPACVSTDPHILRRVLNSFLLHGSLHVWPALSLPYQRKRKCRRARHRRCKTCYALPVPPATRSLRTDCPGQAHGPRAAAGKRGGGGQEVPGTCPARACAAGTPLVWRIRAPLQHRSSDFCWSLALAGHDLLCPDPCYLHHAMTHLMRRTAHPVGSE